MVTLSTSSSPVAGFRGGKILCALSTRSSADVGSKSLAMSSSSMSAMLDVALGVSCITVAAAWQTRGISGNAL